MSLHSRRETGLGWEPAPLGVSDTHQVTIPVVLNEGFDCLQAGNVPAFPPWVSCPPVGGAEMVQGLGLLCDLGEVCFPFWAPMLGMGLCGHKHTGASYCGLATALTSEDGDGEEEGEGK